MKKSYFLGLLGVSLLLVGCTPTDTPTPQPEVSGNVVEEVEEVETGELLEVSSQVFPEKESKYTWSRHMEKPELTEMDNFDEMMNGVDKDWTRDYEITDSDVERISKYCDSDKIEVYDDYNEWGDLEPIQTMRKSEVVKGKTITVSGKYTADPLAVLTDDQQKVLSKNGWLIAPASTLKSLYQINYDLESATYTSDGMSEEWIRVIDEIAGNSRENMRYSFNTVLITNDLLLHVYHKLFENSLKYYEETEARDTIASMAAHMVQKFNTLASQEESSELKEIYQFLAAYWSIPTILLPDTEALQKEGEYGMMEDMNDDEWKQVVLERAKTFAEKFEAKYGETEYSDAIIDTVESILDASDPTGGDYLILAYSPDYVQDNQLLQNYTLYQPRSHYTDSNGLKTYFMAAKYVMREKFYFGDENLIKAALVMVSQMDKSEIEEFNNFSDMIKNLVGSDDDLTLNALITWAKKNKLTDPQNIISNLTKENIAELSDIIPQKIASSTYLVNYTGEVSESEGKSMTDGFVFFGEKFTFDAYLFDLNTASSVEPEFETKPNIQTALMVPDILEGNSLANELVKLRLTNRQSQGQVTEKQVASYDEVRAQSVEKSIEALKDSDTINNIYHKWLNALGRLLTKVDENAPYFKQSRAYALKNIVTYLGSYTELKHDTLLYVKQPMMAELGGGGMGDCEIVVEAPALPVPKGYIEADIDLIDELLNLSKETKEYYRDTAYENMYINFETILENLKTMTQKQMKNEKISDEDFEWMRNLDGTLYDIVTPIKKDYANPTIKENRGSLIADIFTSEGNNVLYEAIGRPALMYLMVKDANGARVVVGPVFTQYEFYQEEAPIMTASSTRFTDEDWQADYDRVAENGEASSLAMQEMEKEMK